MRLLAGASVIVVALSGVAVVQATDLEPEYVGVQWDDPQYQTSDCEVQPQSGEVVWHFMLLDGPFGTTLTADFDGVLHESLPTRETSAAIHWDVITGRGATLWGASTDFDGLVLRLIEICVGDEEEPQPSFGASPNPGAGGTQVGTDVLTAPAENGVPTPHQVMFQSVTVAGTTTVTTSATGPELPSGYQVGDPPRFYDLQTTATHSGPILVCFSYGGVVPAPTTLLHFEGGVWADITTFVDTGAQLICGETTSLSPFVAVNVIPPAIVGFLQPLNDPISESNPMSVFKGGSTVPFKLALRDASGALLSDADASEIAEGCALRISLVRTAAGAPAIDEAATSATPNIGNCFRYDPAADQFVFNLGTKGLVKPATYEVTASLFGPGSTLLATHTLAIGIR